MFTFPLVSSVVSLLRLVVLDAVVTMVIRIMIQLRILHRALLGRRRTNKEI